MAKSLKTNQHSAPGPMLGYLFQIERALLWLSTSTEKGYIAIETDDDLVINLKNNKNLGIYYEQDKSAAMSNRNPFSNKSLDLWKTLHIWVMNINNSTIDLDSSQFLLVTNKVVGTCLIKSIVSLKDNDTEFQNKITELLNNGKSSATQEIKDYALEVEALDATTRTKLFKNIVVLDLNYVHDRSQFKSFVKDNLHVSNSVPFNSMYKDLLGWLTDLIIEKWINNEQAIISGEELNTYFNDMLVRYMSKPFIERAKDVLPVQDSLRALHKKDNFVKQLDWIDMEEQDILKAIDDFLRARWERVRFAKEGNIPSKKDFISMDDDLFERWENLQKPIKRSCSDDIERKNKGYELYWAVMNHKAKLANYDTEQSYTTKGAYHLMANEFRLGWHFGWDKLKDEL
ncbi:ABC-three component system protein [Mucilaginibacter rubeus]|uniref:ABC-three component systems C-terminal domain-containing protein n=1 Tax=Mucilaginibacter rubeus TaxID=2027860 RepID=A0A5C1I3E1_9SPHI|nr:ABC-three component system protein [Mucilaginibacter rubeus]QEM12376.1 hypothetical protein DEO27_020930 [Mucilaginibacter rubeus]